MKAYPGRGFVTWHVPAQLLLVQGLQAPIGAAVAARYPSSCKQATYSSSELPSTAEAFALVLTCNMAASHLHHAPAQHLPQGRCCPRLQRRCMHPAPPTLHQLLQIQSHSNQHSPLSTCKTLLAQALPEQQIEFLNHRGEKLVGTLTDPEAPEAAAVAAAGMVPVVILAHGYMSSRNSELLVRLATAFGRSCKLASFRFDFSGNGDSEGDFCYGQYR